ncbi:MAG: right-handed parallel beta-helix repeat-containing protein [Candidatus Methanomethylicia archaeon]
MARSILIILLFTHLLIGITSTCTLSYIFSNENVIYVDSSNVNDPLENGSREHPFDKIQEGINAAPNGATVKVLSGIYVENIVVEKSINLIGENAEDTIINANYNGHGIIVGAGSIVISGFTIMNAYNAKGYMPPNRAHAIDIRHGNVKIERCVIRNSLVGIYLGGASNNVISNISIQGAWIGVWMEFGSCKNTIENCHVYGCDWGIHIKESSNDNTIKNCILHDNHKNSINIVLSSSRNIIENCVLYGETDTAIDISWYSDNNVVENCIIRDINGEKAYDGIYLYACVNNIIRNCKIYNIKQFGILIGELENGVICTYGNIIQNCTIHNCFRGINFWNGLNNVITQCIFYNNKHQAINIEGCGMGDGLMCGRLNGAFLLKVRYLNVVIT